MQIYKTLLKLFWTWSNNGCTGRMWSMASVPIARNRCSSVVPINPITGFFIGLANIDAPLDAGDFSLIDRHVLDVINQLPERNRFFRGLRAWSGFRQVGIAYERDPRAAGVTKYPLHRLIKLAFDGIFNFSTTPLTAVFISGLLMSGISFIVLILVLVFRIFDIPIFGMRASDVQGFSSTILTILLIGGIQL